MRELLLLGFIGIGVGFVETASFELAEPADGDMLSSPGICSSDEVYFPLKLGYIVNKCEGHPSIDSDIYGPNRTEN